MDAAGDTGFRLLTSASTASTNEDVKSAARDGEPAGLVVSSLFQHGGYGRQGRTWVSPVGGLYTSFLLHPTVPLAQFPSLSPAIALAVVRTLDDMMLRRTFTCVGFNCQIVPDAPQIKWPNDIVCNGRKVSGISLEKVGDDVCVGIGINVFAPKGGMDVGGKNVPDYLARLLQRDDAVVEGDALTESQLEYMEEVLAALLRRTREVFDQWNQGGFPAVRAAYESRASLMGQHISLQTLQEEQIVSGVVEGFDDAARLLVRQDSGQLYLAGSGEVHIL